MACLCTGVSRALRPAPGAAFRRSPTRAPVSGRRLAPAWAGSPAHPGQPPCLARPDRLRRNVQACVHDDAMDPGGEAGPALEAVQLRHTFNVASCTASSASSRLRSTFIAMARARGRICSKSGRRAWHRQPVPAPPETDASSRRATSVSHSDAPNRPPKTDPPRSTVAVLSPGSLTSRNPWLVAWQ